MVRDTPASNGCMLSTRPVDLLPVSFTGREANGRYGIALPELVPLVLCMMITLLRPWPALVGRRRYFPPPRRVFPLWSARRNARSERPRLRG